MAQGYASNDEISEICNKLWELDENRCEPEVHYELDLQGYVTSTRNMRSDWADAHLFSWLDEDVVFEKPTYKAFRALLDNYESETGRPEEITQEEFQENVDFINLIMETPVMKEAHQFLVEKNRAPEEEDEFKKLLYNIWFKMYKRSREDRHIDSSGFEHVFVGESRGHECIGFHNWLQFYLQEKRGHVDYRGFFRRGTAEEEIHPRLITLQFIWKKDTAKPIGSSFIGTSPEFEMALYTVLFRMKKESTFALIQDYEVELKCYRHGRGVGTAFPISKCD